MIKKPFSVWVVYYVVSVILIIGLGLKLSNDQKRESSEINERYAIYEMIKSLKMMWLMKGEDNDILKISRGENVYNFNQPPHTKNIPEEIEVFKNGIQKDKLIRVLVCENGWHGRHAWYSLRGNQDWVSLVARMTNDFRESRMWEEDWKKNVERPDSFLKKFGLPKSFIATIKKMSSERKMGVLEYLDWAHYWLDL